MEITIPQECILLCRKGMHSIERDALEFPKQLNCSSKRFFEERKKKSLIPLLHTSQCCHLRKFRNCWLCSARHFEAHHCNELWHWCEQSLSGSARSNLCEFLHLFIRAASLNSYSATTACPGHTYRWQPTRLKKGAHSKHHADGGTE